MWFIYNQSIDEPLTDGIPQAAFAQRVAAQQQQQQQQNQQGPNQQQLLANGGVPARPPNAVPQSVAPGIPGAVPQMPNGMPSNGAINQRPHPSLQGIPNGVGMNGPIPPGNMPMKMMPQGAIQQPIAGRPGVPHPQSSPDNARIIREASRLQEQQRLVQSRQQQQQQQQHPQHPQHQHQFQNQQPFVPQGPHSSPNNMNMANVNANSNSTPSITALQSASGVASPSFHAPSVVQGVSSASPRMNQPTPLSNSPMPTLSSLQNTIQRTNPSIPPEQANKLATERLHHYQQQRMSQAAMNAAAGNMGAVPAGFQMQNDNNVQHLSQGNMANGSTPLQSSQAQGYSPLMRVTQSGQQGRMGVNSPAMNGMVLQQSRSATPQAHRSGSTSGGPPSAPPPPGKSPHPTPAQTASS